MLYKYAKGIMRREKNLSPSFGSGKTLKGIIAVGISEELYLVQASIN